MNADALVGFTSSGGMISNRSPDGLSTGGFLVVVVGFVGFWVGVVGGVVDSTTGVLGRVGAGSELRAKIKTK